MKQIITIITLLTFSVFTIGCSSYQVITPDKRNEIKETEKIFMVVKSNNENIKIGNGGIDSLKIGGNDLEVYSNSNSINKIPFDSIKTIYTKEYSPTKTWILVGSSVIIGVPLILFWIFSSTVNFGG